MLDNLKKIQKHTLKTTILSNQDIAQYYDMIVFCHLRWQFIYQRPQHIISRMAKTMKILFIEEPLYDKENKNSGTLIVVNSMLHVLQPNVKDIELIAAIVPNYVKNKSIPFGWFYSPAFSPLLEQINFETVIYDCMDEFPVSKGISLQLINQEKYLMAQADIIFTNKKSLFQSKKEHHDNVYCFLNSVDEAHFAKASNGIAIADDIASIQSPIVGYYGVIDDRIDLDLLNSAALRLPDVSFVMIGPLTKISDSDLSKESNIHYLGTKSYEQLPHYLKAFSIAMMPFAINDAAKNCSPTKTLEYMAAGKSIISTKITDVVGEYSTCVSLIETADEFCESITFLLDKTDRLSLEMEYHKILKKTSWDATANNLKSIIKTFAQWTI